MVVDSKLPRDYRIHCHLFTDEKLDEQYRRHTAGALEGNLQSAACLVEIRKEAERRVFLQCNDRYAELRQRRAERRANKS